MNLHDFLELGFPQKPLQKSSSICAKWLTSTNRMTRESCGACNRKTRLDQAGNTFLARAVFASNHSWL